MIEPKVGVAIIITKGNQILLIRRKNVHGAGSWSTPGGHLDFGETPEACARREALEETGVEITNIRFRAITNDVFTAPGKHYISIWMESEYLSGEAHIAADYEVEEIGWFTWDALPEPLFLPFENLVNRKYYPPPQQRRKSRNDLSIEGPLRDQSSLCVPLLRLNADWFGIEAAILEYEREIEHIPTFLAKAEDRVIGFLSLKQHTPHSAEILVMAVHPDAQRGGIGRALVEAAEQYACGLGVEYMQVKTLGPSNPDPGYAKTRAFYEALAYRPMEEFKKIWDEINPCLILVKRL
jgi:8-oxo-dGTP diphosphatase